MKIFLDDIRYPRIEPEGWTIIRNYADFIWTWVQNRQNVTHISFDHDLGEGERSGYDALCVVEEDYEDGIVSNLIVMTVHSANPVGAEKMVKVIKRLEGIMLAKL